MTARSCPKCQGELRPAGQGDDRHWACLSCGRKFAVAEGQPAAGTGASARVTPPALPARVDPVAVLEARLNELVVNLQEIRAIQAEAKRLRRALAILRQERVERRERAGAGRKWAWTKAEDEQLLAGVQQGLSYGAIAEQVGRSERSVDHRVRRLQAQGIKEAFR